MFGLVYFLSVPSCSFCHQKCVCALWSEHSRCSTMEELWRDTPPRAEKFPPPLDAAWGSNRVKLTHPFSTSNTRHFASHPQWKTLSQPGKPNLPYLGNEGRRCLIPLHKVSGIQQLQLRHIFFFFFSLHFSAGAEYWHLSHSIMPCCFLSSKNNRKGRLKGRSRQIWKRIVSSKVWWDLLENICNSVSPVPKSHCSFQNLL